MTPPRPPFAGLTLRPAAAFDRHLLIEMIPFFLIGFCFFDLLFIIAKLLDMMDLLIVKRVEFALVGKLFVTMLPFIFAETIPISILVSVLMTFGRMSSDSEIIALLVSGTSYWRMVRAPLVVGLLASLVMVVFNDTVLPAGNYAFSRTLNEIGAKRPFSQLQEHRFVRIENRTFAIDRIDNKNNMLYNVIIYEMDPATGGRIITTASKGSWLKNQKVRDQKGAIYQVMRLQLENGSVQSYEGRENREFHLKSFSSLVITIKARVTEDFEVSRNPRSIRLSELAGWIKQERKIRNNPSLRVLTMEYHKRFSIPFASLAFILLGIGLALLPKKTGIGFGLGLSIVIVIAYWLMLTAGETLGRMGRLPPIPAVWYPDAVLAIAGFGILWRISK